MPITMPTGAMLEKVAAEHGSNATAKYLFGFDKLFGFLPVMPAFSKMSTLIANCPQNQNDVAYESRAKSPIPSRLQRRLLFILCQLMPVPSPIQRLK